MIIIIILFTAGCILESKSNALFLLVSYKVICTVTAFYRGWNKNKMFPSYVVEIIKPYLEVDFSTFYFIPHALSITVSRAFTEQKYSL